ncbi:MAG: nuclear transport factor 2 family protein [Cyclobacteriaceae bacterium]|nr:nuclear transport factor 2 family protein [Cyclobacteriaceae bacterium]
MKGIILLTFSILSNLSFSQSTSRKQIDMTNEENQIIAVTDSVIQYMIEKSLDGLRTILDKDFTLTHITGYVQSRKEWFSEIETEGMKYYSAKKTKHEIKINGNEAVSTFQHLLDARIWGSRNTWRLQQKMKLEKRNNQWIVINSIASTF